MSDVREDAVRGDVIVADLLPACPSCGDLCDDGAVYCAECGVRLTEGE